MKLIAGLGNPGFRYRHTRHNIGFMVIDQIASDLKIRMNKRSYNSLYGIGKIDDEEAVLVKPLTYMNLSGAAITEIKKIKDIPLEEILIILDDIDLPLGKIRLRPKGSSGGHKGLRSIIEKLGTEDFPRLRVGIGPERREGFLSDYVLNPFKRSEKGELAGVIEKGTVCAKAWADEGLEAAMNRFNS